MPIHERLKDDDSVVAIVPVDVKAKASGLDNELGYGRWSYVALVDEPSGAKNIRKLPKEIFVRGKSLIENVRAYSEKQRLTELGEDSGEWIRGLRKSRGVSEPAGVTKNRLPSFAVIGFG